MSKSTKSPILINGYVIDMATSEDHAFDSEVTDHPVEIGADVTDNIQAKPITVTIDCIVSDTPIGSVAAARNSLDPDQSFFVPSSDCYAHMIAVRDAKQPVSVTTSLGTFANMAMVSMSVPRNAQNGESLRFKVTFKQIKFVTNSRTTIRVAVPRAAAKKDLGNKATTPNNTATASRTALAHIFDWFGGDGPNGGAAGGFARQLQGGD